MSACHKFLLSICAFILISSKFVVAQDETNQDLFIFPIRGIENPVVTCVYKDAYDFVWFGSLNGLYRWDGITTKHYYHSTTDSTTLPYDQIISFLFQDESYNLWFGTLGQGIMKYERNTEKFTLYSLNEKKPKLIDTKWITRGFLDADSIIWVIGITNKLYRYDLKSGDLEVLIPDTAKSDAIINNIFCIAPDNSGSKIWVGTEGGLFKLINDQRKFVPVKFKSENKYEFINQPIIEIHLGFDSTIYWASFDAVYKYNVETLENNEIFKVHNFETEVNKENIQEIILDPSEDRDLIWVFTNLYIYKIFEASGKVVKCTIKSGKKEYEFSKFISAKNVRFIDKNEFLWLATDNLGAAVINLKKNPFTHHVFKKEDNDAGRNGATSFLMDHKNNFWVGTGSNGLYKFDNQMHVIANFISIPDDPFSLSSNYIYSLLEDITGTIWVGTENGLNKLNSTTKKFQRYLTVPLNYDGGRPNVRISELFQDKNGFLWVGTSQGAYYSQNVEIEDIQFQPFKEIPPHFTLIQEIFTSKEGDLWMVTPIHRGIFQIKNNKNTLWETINYNNAPDNNSNFITDGSLSMLENDKGFFWMGTKEGLYKWDRRTNIFEHYHKGNGLDGNMIYWIEDDNQGNLWLSTEVGLIRFNSSLPHERMSKVFTYKDGLPFQDMYPYRFYKSPDGRLFIGGRKGSGDGFYYFHPDSVTENSHIPSIVITKFNTRDSGFKLDSNIVVKKSIVLNYYEDFFSFEFSALDYSEPEKNQYACFLDGFEQDWNYTGKHNFANYTGVPPGDYIFRVKGSNNDGYWNEMGTSIAITILPPPWKTWWAFTLYGLVIIGIIYTIFRYYLKRQQLLLNLELEHVQSEKLAEIGHMKSRFFANISHEFRTPLTLILGPLEKLKSLTSDPDCYNDLNIMQRNALRLQNLINQLLNLSRLESGQIRLRAAKENIVMLISGYVQSFESLAKKRNIDLVFKTEKQNIEVCFDRDKLEKILYNLLSNAFKFTDDGGRIEVEIKPLELGQRLVTIRISDTGRGIPSEKLQHIFNRFYQVNDLYSKDHEGSGIGLALVKELVELHHGSIEVFSKLGKGSTFVFTLPLGKDHLKPEEIINGNEYSNANYTIKPQTIAEVQKVAIKDDTINDESKPILLIIEDNDDLRAYIRSYLTKDYVILEANDGEAGLQKTIDNIPDIVISDVMMPKMDGIEYCEHIKKDQRTNHIPVILLTAKASMEDKIEGLKTGADDFLTKPFDPAELQVRIQNLISQRAALREQFIREIDITGKIMVDTVISEDKAFIQKARKIIEVNLSDFDFSVEDFASEINLSRVQLHRKLKALINQTTGDFVRTVRLNHAAKLIKSKKGNISQIAYEVGFNNLSYFSKCFQEQFGKLPSEYEG